MLDSFERSSRYFPRTKAIAFGAKRETPSRHDGIAGDDARDDLDAVCRGLAEPNLTLDELSGLLRIGKIDHLPITGSLQGTSRYHGAG